MPELPEVETTKNALANKLICGQDKFLTVKIRQAKLRWQVPETLPENCQNQTILAIERIAKYIVIKLQNGSVIIHLGMSGTIKFVKDAEVKQTTDKHTHVIFYTTAGALLYRDPRKFGCVLWQNTNETHIRLQNLGVEPLSADWNADYLYKATRNRRVSIKQLIMNQKIVVGIGNIYATEALFTAKLHPRKPANSITKKQAQTIVTTTINILKVAIECGGTTLKDFFSPDNKTGYFVQKLKVYGKENQACTICAKPIERKVNSGRSDFYCASCQEM